MMIRRNLFKTTIFVLLLILLIVMNYFSSQWIIPTYMEPRVLINTSWTIKVNEKKITDENLPLKLKIKKNDFFSIERKLGMASVLSGPTLFFKTINQVVKVFSDDEEIYSSGIKTKPSLGIVSGEVIHFVRIPQDSSNKITKIVFYPLDSGDAYVIPTIYIGTKFGCVSNFLKDNIAAIIIFFLVLIVCFVYFILYVFAAVRKASSEDYLRMCIFALVSGIAIILETSVLQIMINNSFILYLIFGFIVPTIPMLLINCLQSSYIFSLSRTKKKFFQILNTVNLILFVSTLFVRFINVSYARLFNVIVILFTLGYLIVLSLKRVFKIKTVIDESCISFWICSIGVLADIVRYLLTVEHTSILLFTPYCLILFFAIRAISVVQKYFLSVEQLIKTKTLEEMADTDILTGLKNRKAYEEKREEISESLQKYKPGLIMFDLDEMGETNDTYGHQAGDVLLKTFAVLLSEGFPSNKIYRIGGDEFCVLFENTTEKNIEYRLKRFKSLMDEQNKDPNANQISAACGWGVYDSGRDSNFYTFFKKIDEKMYLNKKD